MGLRNQQGAPTPTFTGIPTELRDRIWQYALELDDTDRGRNIRLRVARQITYNQFLDPPFAPFDATFTYSSPDVPVPQSIPALRLVNRQSNAEVQSLLNRNARYISELRYLQGVENEAGPQQRIWFHPRRDTIRMNIPSMKALHTDWADIYNTRFFLQTPIEGLQDVQNLVLPRTFDENGDAMNLEILHILIPFSQIPVPPAGSEGSQSNADSEPTAADVAFVNNEIFETTAYFPNAVVRFTGPVWTQERLDNHLQFIDNQLKALVPPGEVRNGSFPNNLNPNMAQRIEDIINELWRNGEDWLEMYRQ